MNINVYDFDNTIYKGDSTLDFYFFCLRRHKKTLLYIPRQLVATLSYILKKSTKTQYKQRFFGFLNAIEDLDDTLNAFWRKNIHKIAPWYLKQKSDRDVIISASPHFLLEKVCQELGIRYLIASDVDKRTGVFYGPNCYGDEKVRRLREMFPDAKINRFYSDSYSDMPLAKIADNSFLIKGQEIIEWKL